MEITPRIFYKGITVLLWTVMLLSCKNDIKKVNNLTSPQESPEMSGENLIMLYSDSAKIRYKVVTPLYNKINREKEKYDEFPRGIHFISYDQQGKLQGEITAKYAKKLEEEMIWEARDSVVVINAEGAKLETELLFWDTKKGKIYSDRYARLTSGGQIIEGNNGFESDQNLQNPVFKNITGRVEVEN